ncbi:MAG: ATP-binding protein, partial [Geobacteraceae bacterium]
MSTRIRILPESLTNKIAAGEVVERPASVVKELVENALDSGCGEVVVEIEAGGKKLIKVVDDGSGMSREDALLALERHATSKIAADSDLFNLSTLGFRGEAQFAFDLQALSQLIRISKRAPGVFKLCLRLDLLFALLPEFLLKPTEFALAIIQRSLEGHRLRPVSLRVGVATRRGVGQGGAKPPEARPPAA